MIIFALADPRDPTLIRYLGRTEVDVQKRTRDLISASRFKIRHEKVMPPVMEWIGHLLEIGLEPEATVLFEGSWDDTMATMAELLMLFRGTTLNDLTPTRFHSGKTLGIQDDEAGRRHKVNAWKTGIPREMHERSIKNLRLGSGAGTVTKRTRMGLPCPELPCNHPANQEVYYAILAERQQKPDRPHRQIQLQLLLALRTAWKFPHPELHMQHPLNAAHRSVLIRQGHNIRKLPAV